MTSTQDAGRKGGRAKSERKRAACAENLRKARAAKAAKRQPPPE